MWATDLKPVRCDNAQLGFVESNGEFVPDHHPVVAAHGQQATTSWTTVKQNIKLSQSSQNQCCGSGNHFVRILLFRSFRIRILPFKKQTKYVSILVVHTVMGLLQDF